MIEKYFAEKNATLVKVTDNGTSISFEVTCPDWGTNRIVTLSDIGVGQVLGLSLKDFTREDFIKEVESIFPLTFESAYNVPDWEFPCPQEWVESINLHIETLKKQRILASIDGPYIEGLEPPLFGLYFLKGLENEYGNKNIPASLQRLYFNPELLFETEKVYLGRS